MKENQKYQGTLIKWKDDKGFGFIKPQQGKEEIFIHISALKKAARRPTVGDVICYQLTTGKDGKIKACHAEIMFIPAEPSPKRTSFQKPRKPQNLQRVLVAVGIIGISTIFISIFNNQRIVSPNLSGSLSDQSLVSLPKPGCQIKGNISYNSGNKVYHIPGQKDYEQTRIDLEKGEKWFCTEAEAEAQGWRKAPE